MAANASSELRIGTVSNDPVSIRANNVEVAVFGAAGGMTIGGNTVWHAGNDGSGSGLDADTLDTLSSGSFTTDAEHTTRFHAGMGHSGHGSGTTASAANLRASVENWTLVALVTSAQAIKENIRPLLPTDTLPDYI